MSKPADRGSKNLISLAPDAGEPPVPWRPAGVACVVIGAESAQVSSRSGKRAV